MAIASSCCAFFWKPWQNINCARILFQRSQWVSTVGNSLLDVKVKQGFLFFWQKFMKKTLAEARRCFPVEIWTLLCFLFAHIKAFSLTHFLFAVTKDETVHIFPFSEVDPLCIFTSFAAILLCHMCHHLWPSDTAFRFLFSSSILRVFKLCCWLCYIVLAKKF